MERLNTPFMIDLFAYFCFVNILDNSKKKKDKFILIRIEQINTGHCCKLWKNISKAKNQDWPPVWLRDSLKSRHFFGKRKDILLPGVEMTLIFLNGLPKK